MLGWLWLTALSGATSLTMCRAVFLDAACEEHSPRAGAPLRFAVSCTTTSAAPGGPSHTSHDLHGGEVVLRLGEDGPAVASLRSIEACGGPLFLSDPLPPGVVYTLSGIGGEHDALWFLSEPEAQIRGCLDDPETCDARARSAPDAIADRLRAEGCARGGSCSSLAEGALSPPVLARLAQACLQGEPAACALLAQRSPEQGWDTTRHSGEGRLTRRIRSIHRVGVPRGARALRWETARTIVALADPVDPAGAQHAGARTLRTIDGALVLSGPRDAILWRFAHAGLQGALLSPAGDAVALWFPEHLAILSFGKDTVVPRISETERSPEQPRTRTVQLRRTDGWPAMGYAVEGAHPGFTDIAGQARVPISVDPLQVSAPGSSSVVAVRLDPGGTGFVSDAPLSRFRFEITDALERPRVVVGDDWVAPGDVILAFGPHAPGSLFGPERLASANDWGFVVVLREGEPRLIWANAPR